MATVSVHPQPSTAALPRTLYQVISKEEMHRARTHAQAAPRYVLRTELMHKTVSGTQLINSLACELVIS